MALNNECKHNISDDECYKCLKYGIILRCLARCKDFDNVEYQKPEENNNGD